MKNDSDRVSVYLCLNLAPVGIYPSVKGCSLGRCLWHGIYRCTTLSQNIDNLRNPEEKLVKTSRLEITIGGWSIRIPVSRKISIESDYHFVVVCCLVQWVVRLQDSLQSPDSAHSEPGLEYPPSTCLRLCRQKKTLSNQSVKTVLLFAEKLGVKIQGD
ncbi:hypothetical protein PPACK8108_LOCUS11084 [Phakopsora pachyrhizi]|uniref:Uncharacterized protein n=1 Tax=Phakopsora pachyrhizi TaxID=170000 RepID=A0AAV0B4H5_PHAPC|nr:hypothetical protein PPACK8108_LOCUS11084 [Phakopsora pachyrhizi]